MIGFVFLLSVATAALAAPSALVHRDSKMHHLAECGATTACFVYPANCHTDDTCLASVSVKSIGGMYEFAMESVGGVYIAVGLSNDAMMGEDSVVECVNDAASGATGLSLYMSYNTNHTNARVPTVGTTLGMATYDTVTKTAHCMFTRDASTTVAGTVFDLDTTPYHLLLAVGTMATADGLVKHDLVNQPSADARMLGQPGMFTNVPPPTTPAPIV